MIPCELQCAVGGTCTFQDNQKCIPTAVLFLTQSLYILYQWVHLLTFCDCAVYIITPLSIIWFSHVYGFFFVHCSISNIAVSHPSRVIWHKCDHHCWNKVIYHSYCIRRRVYRQCALRVWDHTHCYVAVPTHSELCLLITCIRKLFTSLTSWSFSSCGFILMFITLCVADCSLFCRL